jgi:hypothetical protein
MAGKGRRKSKESPAGRGGEPREQEPREPARTADAAPDKTTERPAADPPASPSRKTPEPSTPGVEPKVPAVAKPAAEPPRTLAPVVAARPPAPARPLGRIGQLGAQTAMSYGQGRHAGADWVESVRHHVHERPIHSVLVAAGLGFLIGVIWK